MIMTSLELSKEKKIMAVTRKFGPLEQTVMNNNNIEVVENFVYLGSQLCNEGESDADMKRCIAFAVRSNISQNLIMGKGFQKT